MTTPDVQIVRAEILTGCLRPAPEPTEAEIRQVAEYIGTSPEATATATAETLEADR